MTFTVYRIYNDFGELLYIGCTHDFWGRLTQHKDKAPWYGEMSYRLLKEYDCRSKAEAVEARAIWMMEPEYNVAHQKD